MPVTNLADYRFDKHVKEALAIANTENERKAAMDRHPAGKGRK